MLGWKGYNNGFVEYASNIHYTKQSIYTDLSHPKKGTTVVNYKTDSMALSQISNNQFANFSDYKKYRFNDIKDKLDRLDADEIVASNFTKNLNYANSTNLRYEIYYYLKNTTNDFRKEIFKDTTQQTINNLAE